MSKYFSQVAGVLGETAWIWLAAVALALVLMLNYGIGLVDILLYDRVAKRRQSPVLGFFLKVIVTIGGMVLFAIGLNWLIAYAST